MKRSRFRLQDGEQVSLPSVLVMAYHGEWIAGQNQFRGLMLRHFTPRASALDLMPVAASVHGMIGFNDTTEAKLTALAGDVAACRLPLDTYWLDAGWNQGGFPPARAIRPPTPARFPRGLAPLGTAVRKAGMRFLVWFEPERAMRGTWLDREHADWLLQPSGTPGRCGTWKRTGFACSTWAILASEPGSWRRFRADPHAGITVYRQDFNAIPLTSGTRTDRRMAGLREVRHVTGLYAFLDELARRHPDLILDNCASGGRRLDFEMMRRCVALWRSDSCWGEMAFPRNVQAMTHGLSLWLPLHGLGAAATDDTALRSGMGCCASFAINFRDADAVEALRRHLQRYLKVRPLFSRDFYPLTPWSDDPATTLAFQFHDPESGEGIVQIFRARPRRNSSGRLRLRGLDPAATYMFTDWDAALERAEIRGAELIGTGLSVTARPDQEAVVLPYGLCR